MTGEDSTVEYTVKELLGEIKTELHGISAKLDTKADALDLLAVSNRVTALEEDRLARDTIAAKADSGKKWRTTILAVVFTALGVAVGLVALFVQ